MYPEKILKQVFSHSIDEYPFECCGFILESIPEGEQSVLPCKNIQNEIHQLDSKKNPRDARTAFAISPEDLLKMNKMLYGQKYKLKAIYHSHPDHKAYFSDEDRSFATFENEPVYPETDHIIVSIEKKIVKDAVCFSWESKSKSFQGRKIEVTY